MRAVTILLLGFIAVGLENIPVAFGLACVCGYLTYLEIKNDR